MDLLDFLDRLQFLENVKLLGQKRKRRHTRVRNNRMSNYTDEEFITRFRLSKESVLYLIPLIERKLRRSKR